MEHAAARAPRSRRELVWRIAPVALAIAALVLFGTSKATESALRGDISRLEEDLRETENARDTALRAASDQEDVAEACARLALVAGRGLVTFQKKFMATTPGLTLQIEVQRLKALGDAAREFNVEADGSLCRPR